jgi:adenosine kinase
VAVNDYEGHMLCERTGESLETISRRENIDGIVVTLAEQGCDVWQRGRVTRVPGVPAEAVVDPTGCGDAVRAGLLYALERGWPLARAAALGNRLGAIKIAQRGGQNHRFEPATLNL